MRKGGLLGLAGLVEGSQPVTLTTLLLGSALFARQSRAAPQEGPGQGPAALEKVYEQEGKILVFADFAGRIAPLLSALNQGRNLTLIPDHHVAEASTDPRVMNFSSGA